MSNNNASESFVGMASIFILAGVVCLPILGWYSVIGAASALYFGLVFMNGSASAAKRHNNKQRRRR